MFGRHQKKSKEFVLREDTTRLLLRFEQAINIAAGDKRATAEMETIRAGEWEISFENICSNLDDFQIPVDRDQYNEIIELGIRMKVNPDYWRSLTLRDE